MSALFTTAVDSSMRVNRAIWTATSVEDSLSSGFASFADALFAESCARADEAVPSASDGSIVIALPTATSKKIFAPTIAKRVRRFLDFLLSRRPSRARDIVVVLEERDLEWAPFDKLWLRIIFLLIGTTFAIFKLIFGKMPYAFCFDS